MSAPDDPPIFHITHVDNLRGIVASGGLWSDAERIARNVGNVNIGHLHIKQRRLMRPVTTTAGGKLGEYVPFNFCSRSVMLYAVSRGHPDYQGGQASVVHLVSTLQRAIALGRAWAFTDRHAELAHALHFDDLAKLGEVPWHVMSLEYWTDVREERQAEFLVRDFFPWSAIAGIGVQNEATAARVREVLEGVAHKPPVGIRPGWYY